MSNMLDWAKREVEIACKKENPNRKESEFNYECACYESALKAFEGRIIDEMFPITMPYMPGRTNQGWLRGFLNRQKNGALDTVSIYYALKEENGEQKRIEINRFSEEVSLMNLENGLKYP